MEEARLSFTGAKFDGGKIRVDVFEDHDVAAWNYSLMRSIGGPRRIVLGKGLPSDDRDAVIQKVEALLRAS